MGKLSPHEWFDYRGRTCCRLCGNVRNATSDERLCKGPVRVSLREALREAGRSALIAKDAPT